MSRRTGIIHLKVNGTGYQAKVGSIKYGLGIPKREGITAADGTVIGPKETPQVPFIEGEIFDDRNLDLKDLQMLDDGTATLELAYGKTIILRNCWFAGTGEVQTEEGIITFRLEGRSAEEVK